MTTNIWKIDCQDSDYEILVNSIQNNFKKQLYVLDINKTSFDIVEKYVYDIAKSHFDRLGIDISTKYVEFWYKSHVNISKDLISGINNFHIDCDEVERKCNNIFFKPLLSCVSYFNTCDFPTLITQVNNDEYKFKKFENKNEIQLIFPEERKQITFVGTNFHGVLNISNLDANTEIKRLMFAINLWDRIPTDICLYKNQNKNENIYQKEPKIFGVINNENQFATINNKKKQFDFNFYETMLYDKYNFVLNADIIKAIREYTGSEKNFIIADIIENKESQNVDSKTAIFDKLNSQIQKINNITEDTLDIFYNRFIQRFIYNNVFSKSVCEWLIYESEEYAKKNNGWTTHRHAKYPTTDIPLENITNIFNFCLYSFNDFFKKIQNSYCLPDYVNFNIIDLFIVKYDYEMQNSLELHHDGSFLSLNILLNDPSEFEGGGTYFNDGITVFSKQGDLIVHSGKVKHSGLPISKGKRYVLVAFVNIIINMENDILEHMNKTAVITDRK